MLEIEESKREKWSFSDLAVGREKKTSLGKVGMTNEVKTRF